MIYQHEGATEDPYYSRGPARVLIRTVEKATRYHVLAGDLGDHLIEIITGPPGRGRIRVQGGQELCVLQDLLREAVLYVTCGPEWARSFRTRPNLRIVPPMSAPPTQSEN